MEAKEARLIESLGGPGGEIRWKATPGAEEESREDHDSAERVVERFKLQVMAHIDALGVEIRPEQRETAHFRLMRVLAAGCARVVDGHSQRVAFLRPVAFDLDSVRSATAQISPKSLREALDELVVAAVDPDDPFGNEMVHLLVVASVLICFMKKIDLGAAPTLAGTQLLLDTQVLVHLIDESTDEQRVVRRLIEFSLTLGAEIVVAEHSLEEWGRLWSAAEQENPAILDTHDPMGAAARLPTDNPFISQFLRAREKNSNLKWDTYLRNRQGIRSLLTNLGVKVRPNGNDRVEDKKFAAQMRSAMGEMQRGTQRHRSDAGIASDAESAAMVARWRSKYDAPPCHAYFVGTDSLIGRAYRDVAPTDDSPLAVRPISWLMYTACLTGDQADVAEMAEVVSSAAVREGFFGVATGYTLEEVLKMSEILREDHSTMSLEDSRDALQLNINDLFKEMQNASADQRAIAAAAEVMRKRNARRNERARKATQDASDIKSISDAKVAQAAQDVARVENARATVEGKLTESERHNRRLKRIMRAAFIGVILLSIVVGLVLTRVISGIGIAVALLSLIYFFMKARSYADSDGVESKKIVRGAITEIILLAIAALVKF